MDKYIQQIEGYLIDYSPKVIAAIAILIIGKWISGKISNIIASAMERSKVDESIIGFAKSISYYCFLVIVLIAAAGQLGINTTSFLTILGAASLAVGLALKDSLSNFSAGVMLIVFRPFRVGDVADVGGTVGKVTEITIFNTIFTSPDNQKIIIPNSSVMGSTITNITANDTRRVDMVFGIGYDDDLLKAKNILLKIANNDERILKDPEVKIAVSELADSSVNFIVRPWCQTEEYWNVKFDFIEQVKLDFDKEGISIPYPQSDVHMHEVKVV